MKASAVVAAGAVALAGALVVVMPDGSPAQEQAPREQSAQGARLPVERTDVVCPPMPAPGDARAAVTAPRLAQQPDLEPNPVQVRAGGSTIARLEERGQVWRGDGDAAGSGVGARANGALAAGLTAVTTSDLDADTASGQATAACVSPGSSWWFVGAGSSVGRDDTVVLANPAQGVAVVDLTFRGPDGEIEDVDSKQIAIEPDSRQEIPLADYVPDVGEVAVEVSARQGQVAAAVSETRVEASTATGSDFVGAAAAPERTTTVTGVPSGPGRRDLVVVNTADSETVVDVEVMGATGAFRPTDLDVLRVPPGGVVSEEISNLTRDEISGLRLSADQPITAAIRSSTPDPDDVAYAPAGEPLADGAATAIPADAEATLVLSAVNQSAAAAQVAVFNQAGEQIGAHDMQVNGGQTVSWRVQGQGNPASFVLTSDDGDQLTGAVQWSSDEGESITALSPLRSTVARPPLFYDPAGR